MKNKVAPKSKYSARKHLTLLISSWCFFLIIYLAAICYFPSIASNRIITFIQFDLDFFLYLILPGSIIFVVTLLFILVSLKLINLLPFLRYEYSTKTKIRLLHPNSFSSIYKKLKKLLKLRGVNALKEALDHYQDEFNKLILTYKDRYPLYKKTYKDVPKEVKEKSNFNGSIIKNALLTIVLTLLTVVSFGLLYPVQLVYSTRYKVSHTVIDGKRLEFNGKIHDIYIHFFKWRLLSIVTVGIYSLFVSRRLEIWKVEHTHIVNEEKESYLIRQKISYYLVKKLAKVILIFTLGLAYPLLVKLFSNYDISAKSIDEKPLWFDGKISKIYGKYLLWLLLGLITLSIYWWFIPTRLERWKTQNTHFANTSSIDNLTSISNNQKYALIYIFRSDKYKAYHKEARKYEFLEIPNELGLKFVALLIIVIFLILFFLIVLLPFKYLFS